jgi:hypothetical protein
MHDLFDKLPDYRKTSPNLKYSLKDAALGAFSMFFSQSSSFLSWQQTMQECHGHNNASTLFGIKKIPSDNQIRKLLDVIPPERFYPLFSWTFDELHNGGHLKDYRFWDGCMLMPIDGTEYFRSGKLNCGNCSVSRHKNGKTTYSHKVLTPVIVTPNNPKVICLEPEFITPQDGAEKQDCELNAAKRWIERNADLAKHKVIILGDDLFSREPFCQLILSKGFHFVLVCKPDSHKTLYEYVDYLEKSTDIKTLSFKKWNGRFHELFNFRYCNNLPIKDGENVLQVNWVEITVTNLSTGRLAIKIVL